VLALLARASSSAMLAFGNSLKWQIFEVCARAPILRVRPNRPLGGGLGRVHGLARPRVPRFFHERPRLIFIAVDFHTSR